MARNTWISNFGQSVKFGAIDAARDLNPAIRDLYDTNADYLRNISNLLGGIFRGQTKISESLEKLSPDAARTIDVVQQYAAEGKAKIKHGVKTGQFTTDDTAGSGDEFDFSDFDGGNLGGGSDEDFDFGDLNNLPDPDELMKGSSSQGPSNQLAADIGVAEVGAINANTKAQIAVGKATAASIANVGTAISGQNKLLAKGFEVSNKTALQMNGAVIAAMQVTSEKTNSTLQMINDNLANIIGFNQDTQLKAAMAAMKYYDDSLAELKSINQAMLRISPPKQEKGYEASDWERISNRFSLEEYVDIVKQNAKNIDGLGEIMQILESPEAFASLLADPFKTATSFLIKQGLPTIMKSTMAELNRSLESFLPAVFAKLGGYAYDSEAHPIMQMIGKLFGIQTPYAEMNLGNYEKGAVPFDGITHKTINQVIPTYLSKILAVLSGGEERMFNYQTGVWESLSEIRSRNEYTDRNNRNAAFGELNYALQDSLNDISFENENERRIMMDAIEEFKKAAIAQRKLINWNDQEQIDEIMRNVIVEGLNTDSAKKAIGNWIAGVAKEQTRSTQMEAGNASFNYNMRRRRDVNSALKNYDYGYLHLNSRFDDYVTADDVAYANEMRRRAREQYGVDSNGRPIDQGPTVINNYYGPPQGGLPSGSGPTGHGPSLVGPDGRPLGSSGRATPPPLPPPPKQETGGMIDLSDRLGGDFYDAEADNEAVEMDYGRWLGSINGPRLAFDEREFNRIQRSKGRAIEDKRRDYGMPTFEDLLMFQGKRKDILRMRDEALEDMRATTIDIQNTLPEDLLGLPTDEELEDPEKFEERQKERRRKKSPLEEYNNRLRDSKGAGGILASAINNVNETLYRVIFGASDEEDESVIMILADNIRETFGKLKEWLVKDFYNPVKKFLFGDDFTESKVYKFFSGMFDKAGEAAMGTQDDDGYYSGGFASEFANELTDVSKAIGNQITGKGYKDSSGKEHPDNPDSVFGTMKDATKEALSTLKTYLFGESSDEELKKQRERDAWRASLIDNVNGNEKSSDIQKRIMNAVRGGREDDKRHYDKKERQSFYNRLFGSGDKVYSRSEITDSELNKALGGGISRDGLYILSKGEKILGNFATGTVTETGLYNLKAGQQVIPAGGVKEVEKSQAAEANFMYKFVSKIQGDIAAKLDKVIENTGETAEAIEGTVKPKKPLTEADIKKRVKYTDAAVTKIDELMDKITSIEDVEGKKKPFVDVVFDKVANSVANFAAMLGGSRHFDNQYINQEYASAIRKKAPKALAQGVVAGGALGLATLAGEAGSPFGLLSIFLPGGPIGAMAVGLGLSILHNNENFLDAMYGKKDENGERTGGYVPKKVQDFVKNNKTGLLGGAMMGGIYGLTGFSIPGTILGALGLGGGAGMLSTLGVGLMGPVLFGSAMGLAIKSKAFKEALFGKEDPSDPTGTKKVGGLMNTAVAKKMKQLLPNTIVGAGLMVGANSLLGASGIGLLPMLAMPTFGAALVGGAVGLGMATDKFKDAMFGKFDEKSGKFVSGGLVDTMKKVLEVEIAKPVSVFAQKSFAKMQYWFEKDILYPIGKAVLPMKALAEDIVVSVKDKITAIFTGIATSTGNFLSKLLSPFRWLFKKVWDTTWGVSKTFLNTTFGVAGTLIGLPFKALGVTGDMLRLRAKWKGSETYDKMQAAKDRAEDRLKEAKDRYRDKMSELNLDEKDYKSARKHYRKTGYALSQEELDAKTAQYYEEEERMKALQEQQMIKEDKDRKEAQEIRVQLRDLLGNLNAKLSYDADVGKYVIQDKDSGLQVQDHMAKLQRDIEAEHNKVDLTNQMVTADGTIGSKKETPAKTIRTVSIPKFKKYTPAVKQITAAKITDQTASKLPTTPNRPTSLNVDVKPPIVQGMTTEEQLQVESNSIEGATLNVLSSLYSMMEFKLSQLIDFNLAQAALLKEQNSAQLWVNMLKGGAMQAGRFLAEKAGAKIKQFGLDSLYHGDRIADTEHDIYGQYFAKDAEGKYIDDSNKAKLIRARNKARRIIHGSDESVSSWWGPGAELTRNLTGRDELSQRIDEITGRANPPEGNAAIGGGIPQDGWYILSAGEQVLGNYARGTRKRQIINATKLYRLKKGDTVIPAGGADEIEKSQASEANFMFKVLNQTYGSLAEENETQTNVQEEMRDLLRESLEHLENVDEEIEENNQKIAVGAEGLRELKAKDSSTSGVFGESGSTLDDNVGGGNLKEKDRKTSSIFGGRTAAVITKEREEASYRQSILDALHGLRQQEVKHEEKKDSWFDKIKNLLGIIGAALTATGIYALLKNLYDRFFGGKGDKDPWGYHDTQMVEDVVKAGGSRLVKTGAKAIAAGARGVYRAGKAVGGAALKGAKAVGGFIKDKAETAALHGMYAMDSLAETKLGQKVTGLVEAGSDAVNGLKEKAVAKLGETGEHLANTEAGKWVTKIKDGIAKFIEYFTKDGTIISKLGDNVGKLADIFKGLGDKIDVKKVGQWLAKKGGIVARGAMAGIRTAGGMLTGGIGTAIFAGIDAVRGATDAAEIFEVSPEMVTPGMRVAASLTQVILGLPYVVFVDLALEILYAFTGLNIKKQIAKFVYECLPGATEDIDALQQSTIEAYNKWKQKPENKDKGMQAFIDEKAKAYNPVKDFIRDYVPGGKLIAGTQDEKGDWKDYGFLGGFQSAWDDSSTWEKLTVVPFFVRGWKRTLFGNDDDKGHHRGLLEMLFGGSDAEEELEEKTEGHPILDQICGFLFGKTWEEESTELWEGIKTYVHDSITETIAWFFGIDTERAGRFVDNVTEKLSAAWDWVDNNVTWFKNTIIDGTLTFLFGEEAFKTVDEDGNVIWNEGKKSFFSEYITEPLFGKSASDFAESAGNLWDNLKANMGQEFRYRWRQMTDWIFGKNPDDEPVERPNWGNLFGDSGKQIEATTQAAVGEIVGEPNAIKEMKEESGGNMLDRLSSGVAHMFGGTDPVSGEEIDFFDSYVWKYWYGLPGTMADVISNFIGIGLGEDIEDVTEKNKSLIERGFDGLQFLIGGENPYSGTYVDPKDSYLFEPALGAYKEFKNTLAWFFGEEDTEDYKGKDSLVKRKLKEAWGWAEEKIKSGVADLGKGAEAFAKEANELILAGFDFFLGERLEPDKPPGLSKRGPGLIDRTMQKASDGWTNTMVYVFGDPEQGIDSQLLIDAKTSITELKDSFWKPIEQWGIDRYNDINAFGENLSEKFNAFKDMANKQIEEKGVIRGTFGIVANLFRGLLGLEWDTDPVQKTIDEAMESIKSGFSKLGEVGTNILKFGGIIVDTVSGMISSPVKLAGKIFDYFMGDDLNKDVDSAKKKAGTAKKSFSGFFDEVAKAGGGAGASGAVDGNGFKQKGEQWSGKYLVPGNPELGQMGSDGCGPTSLATAFRSLGYNVTPEDTMKFVNMGNVAKSGTKGVTPAYFSEATARMGGKFIPIDPNNTKALEYFAARNIPIIGGGVSSDTKEFSRSGHYNTFQGGYIKNGKFYLNSKDPLGRDVDVDVQTLAKDVQAGGPQMLGAVVAGPASVSTKTAKKKPVSGYILSKLAKFIRSKAGDIRGGGGNQMFIHAQSADECTRQAASALWNAYTGESTSAGDFGSWYSQLLGMPATEYDFSRYQHSEFNDAIESHFGPHPDWPVFLYQTGGDGHGAHPLNRGSGNHATVIGRKLDNGKYQVFDSNGGVMHELDLDQLFDPTAEGSAKNNTDAHDANLVIIPNNGPNSPITEWGSTNGMSDGNTASGSEAGSTPGASKSGSSDSSSSNDNNPFTKMGAVIAGLMGEYVTSLGQDKVGNYDYTRFLGGSSSSNSSPSSSGNAVSAGEFTGDNVKFAWDYYKKLGVQDAGVAGILGNFAQESGISPTRVEDGYNHPSNEDIDQIYWSGAPGYGLAQWTYYSRQEGLNEYAKSKGKPVSDFGTQLEYSAIEPGRGPAALDAVKAAGDDVHAAASAWEHYFEGAGTPMMENRWKFADEIYANYAGKGGGGMAGRIAKWGIRSFMPDAVINSISNFMDQYPAVVAICDFLDELSPSALYDMYEHTENIQAAVDSGRMSEEEVANIYGNNQFNNVDWDTLGYSGGGGVSTTSLVSKQGNKSTPVPVQQKKPKKRSFWKRLGDTIGAAFGIDTSIFHRKKDENAPVLTNKTESTGTTSTSNSGITENSDLIVKRPGKPEDFGLDLIQGEITDPKMISEVASKLHLEFDELGNVKGLTKVPSYNIITYDDNNAAKYSKQRAQIQHFIEYGGTLPEVVDEEATAKKKAEAVKDLKDKVEKEENKLTESTASGNVPIGESAISDDVNNPVAQMARQLGMRFDGMGNVIGMDIPAEYKITASDNDSTKYAKQAKQIELYAQNKKSGNETSTQTAANTNTVSNTLTTTMSSDPIRTEQWTGANSGVGLNALIDAVKSNDVHAELGQIIQYMKAMVDNQVSFNKEVGAKASSGNTGNVNSGTGNSGNTPSRQPSSTPKLPSFPPNSGNNAMKTNPNNAVSYESVHAKNLEIARGGQFRSA